MLNYNGRFNIHSLIFIFKKIKIKKTIYCILKKSYTDELALWNKIKYLIKIDLFPLQVNSRECNLYDRIKTPTSVVLRTRLRNNLLTMVIFRNEFYNFFLFINSFFPSKNVNEINKITRLFFIAPCLLQKHQQGSLNNKPSGSMSL